MRSIRHIKKHIKKFFFSKKDNEVNRIRRLVNSCGENLQIFGQIEMFTPQKITIGENCRLNNRVVLNARSGIFIGDNVSISYGAKIISTGYDIEHWINTGEKIHFDDKPIVINNHCWIGTDAIILPGINISGEYVIIGAGAVVTKNITESKVIVAGNPAKIVKRLGE